MYCSLSCANTMTNLKRHAARRLAYQQSPRRCTNPECGAELSWERRSNRYCSRRCSARHTQLGGDGRHFTHPKHPCASCGVLTRNPKYCSRACSESRQKLESDRAIQAANGVGFSFSTLRRYMRRHHRRCSICGLTEWQGHPVMLVVDHIDGNPDNDRLDNLRMVCSNCDAQLPTYKNRNRGRGRAWRRERYNAGRSFR